jgi:hypothetical protein
MSAAYLAHPAILSDIPTPHWCIGKERFESAVIAAKIAAKPGRGPRISYLCKRCGGFHVGTSYKKDAPVSKKTARTFVKMEIR